MSQEALELFAKYAPGAKPLHMKSHGRLEIVGNHTDHNRGLTMCSGVSMGITASVSKDDEDTVTIYAKGYPKCSFDIDDLEGIKKAITVQ